MHHALFAERALVHIKTSEAFNPLLGGFYNLEVYLHLRIILLLQCPRPAAIYTIAADLYKPVRQYMLAEPSQKLYPSEHGGFLFGIVGVYYNSRVPFRSNHIPPCDRQVRRSGKVLKH
jgi:hypothetical protein